MSIGSVETELKAIFGDRYSTSSSTRSNYSRGEDTYDPVLSKAVISLKQAIFINPKLIDAHLNLFSVYMELSNLSEAESSIKKAIKLDPNSSISHFNLSRVYLELGKDLEAESSVKKAI